MQDSGTWGPELRNTVLDDIMKMCRQTTQKANELHKEGSPQSDYEDAEGDKVKRLIGQADHSTVKTQSDKMVHAQERWLNLVTLHWQPTHNMQVSTSCARTKEAAFFPLYAAISSGLSPWLSSLK